VEEEEAGRRVVASRDSSSRDSSGSSRGSSLSRHRAGRHPAGGMPPIRRWIALRAWSPRWWRRWWRDSPEGVVTEVVEEVVEADGQPHTEPQRMRAPRLLGTKVAATRKHMLKALKGPPVLRALQADLVRARSLGMPSDYCGRLTVSESGSVGYLRCYAEGHPFPPGELWQPGEHRIVELASELDPARPAGAGRRGGAAREPQRRVLQGKAALEQPCSCSPIPALTPAPAPAPPGEGRAWHDAPRIGAIGQQDRRIPGWLGIWRR
jgi:hypothetical protein